MIGGILIVKTTTASQRPQFPVSRNAKQVGEDFLRATSLANTRHGSGRAMNLPTIDSSLELELSLSCRLERGAREAGLSQR
jgi:hypothetical protein